MNLAARADIAGMASPVTTPVQVSSAGALDSRVLVWASNPQDNEFLCAALQGIGLSGIGCRSLNQFCSQLESGAALAIIDSNLLDLAAWKTIDQLILRQPAWSDFPIIALAEEQDFAAQSAYLDELSSGILLLEKPLKLRSLLSAVRAAVRSRKRQHEIRSLVSKSARRQDALQAKEDIVRERNFSDEAINSLPGLFYALDDRGGLLRWNNALERVTGYSTEEIARMNASEFFAPENQTFVAELIRETFVQGQSVADLPLLAKSGALIPYFFTGKRCILDGRPCVVGMGVDVSEQKRVEQELREARNRLTLHAEELEKRVAERTSNLQASIQSLEGVLYHVAHDLRAPLRTMQGFTTILMEESWGLHGEGIDYARRIAQAASRMDRLIQDLLAYGRMTNAPLNLQPIELTKNVQAVLNQLSDQINSRGAFVQIIGPMLDVYADPALLSQMLTHLLANAINFVAAGVMPTIQIRTEQLNPATVRLSIKDNGIGISPEHHERIFRVFERLEAGGVSTGTGIGLAIVRKGAERMGGTTGLESKIGAGSRFWLDLPASPPTNE